MLGHPVVIAIAVAVFGVLAMLIVDHGPWTRPRVQTAEVANHKTTGDAVRAVGAKVTPTAPKSELEPAVPGPQACSTGKPCTALGLLGLLSRAPGSADLSGC
jgi:hypothetical protein